MSHVRLLGIDVKHSYYSNGLCGDFTVVPDNDTERLFRNHRCVVKPKANGVDMYVETGSDGKPKIAFSANATLSFGLYLKNPEFLLFTDSATLPGGTDYQITYPSQKTDNFFAKISVQRDFSQTVGNSVEIVFSAKPVLWVYYLITDQDGPDADFLVAAQNSEAITWKKMDGMDRISQKLAGQYPGMKQLRFTSEQLVPCREAGLQDIRLLLAGSTVIESLPNPSWRNYFQAKMEASGGNVDAIFQVVKYMTNTKLIRV